MKLKPAVCLVLARTFSCHVLLLLSLVSVGCNESKPSVVIYTSVDDIFARSILDEFENASGIRVDALYDVEAQKTTGLFKRLMAEHDSGRPRADVFWNSEVARTIQLQTHGVLTPYVSPSASDIPEQFRVSDRTWTGFAARARIIIYNRDRVTSAEVPQSIWGLTDERWRGEAAIANPLFGTTATHRGALWSTLGEEWTKEYFQALIANDVQILAGNSTVRDRVASGELKIGLTDTDDAFVAIKKGDRVGIVFPDQAVGIPGHEGALGTFVIPNTVAVITGAPHREAAEKLVDYLLSREVEGRLAAGESAQIPVRDGVKGPQIPGQPNPLVPMVVDYGYVARGVEESRDFFEKLFIK